MNESVLLVAEVCLLRHFEASIDDVGTKIYSSH
jgi:hypothetical protein